MLGHELLQGSLGSSQRLISLVNGQLLFAPNMKGFKLTAPDALPKTNQGGGAQPGVLVHKEGDAAGAPEKLFKHQEVRHQDVLLTDLHAPGWGGLHKVFVKRIGGIKGSRTRSMILYLGPGARGIFFAAADQVVLAVGGKIHMPELHCRKPGLMCRGEGQALLLKNSIFRYRV